MRSSQEGRFHGQQSRPPGKRGKLTLAIDIGGTRLKAGLLDQHGAMVAGPEPRRHAAEPGRRKLVVDALVELAGPLGHFDRISVGFPGVVRTGPVLTAPNLGTAGLARFPAGRRR